MFMTAPLLFLPLSLCFSLYRLFVEIFHPEELRAVLQTLHPVDIVHSLRSTAGDARMLALGGFICISNY